MASLRELEETRAKYNSLHEKARSNEQVVRDRITGAVQVAKAEKDWEFQDFRESFETETQILNQKLQDAEAKITVAEIRASETGIALGMSSMEETIRELSRASLNEDMKTKDEEIAAKEAELLGKGVENERLRKIIAEITTLGLSVRYEST